MTYTEFRLIRDFVWTGQHPSLAPESHGYWHGPGWVVQGLSDEGIESAWQTLAAFTDKRLAAAFYQSDLLSQFGNHR